MRLLSVRMCSTPADVQEQLRRPRFYSTPRHHERRRCERHPRHERSHSTATPFSGGPSTAPPVRQPGNTAPPAPGGPRAQPGTRPHVVSHGRILRHDSSRRRSAERRRRPESPPPPRLCAGAEPPLPHECVPAGAGLRRNANHPERVGRGLVEQPGHAARVPA